MTSEEIFAIMARAAIHISMQDCPWVSQAEAASIEHARAIGVDVNEAIKIAKDALHREMYSLENDRLTISGSPLTAEELIELGID